jgi:hypothetical protein
MMARGSDGRQENIDVYTNWREGKKNLEDFIPYIQRRKTGDVYRWSLGRNKIENELKIGTAINQNPFIRNDLDRIECEMRDEGLLPPDEPVNTEGMVPSTPVSHPSNGLSNADKRRLGELEEENAYLREELKKKDEALKHFGLIDRFLSDTMRIPR